MNLSYSKAKLGARACGCRTVTCWGALGGRGERASAEHPGAGAGGGAAGDVGVGAAGGSAVGTAAKRQRNAGFTLQELLLVVAIICIVVAIAVPSILSIQRNLRQTELDAKAETIYTIAQNQLTKLYASGDASYLQKAASLGYIGEGAATGSAVAVEESGQSGAASGESAGVTTEAASEVGDSSGSAVTAGASAAFASTSGESAVPCDLAAQLTDDEASVVLSDLDFCYTASCARNDASAVACVMLPSSALDDDLRQGAWVVEYRLETGTVYSVFYADDASALYEGGTEEAGSLRYVTEWADNFNAADASQTYRNRDFRLKAGAKIGYYCGVGALKSAAYTLTPHLEIDNGEQLVAQLGCMLPYSAAAGEQLTFELTVTDIAGNSVTRAYTATAGVAGEGTSSAAAAGTGVARGAASAAAGGASTTNGTGNAAAAAASASGASGTTTAASRYCSVEVVLDSLNAGMSFYEQFGAGSNAATPLLCGTEIQLTLTCTAANSQLNAVSTEPQTTNSLFAYADGQHSGALVATASQSGEGAATAALWEAAGVTQLDIPSTENTAFVSCARHLQNLDQLTSHVGDTTGVSANVTGSAGTHAWAGITYALQTADISFAATSAWAKAYTAASASGTEAAAAATTTTTTSASGGTTTAAAAYRYLLVDAETGAQYTYFRPISNKQLDVYNGANHQVRGLFAVGVPNSADTLNAAGSAGLFGAFNGKQIKGVTLVGARAFATAAGASAGSLLGTYNGALGRGTSNAATSFTIDGCSAYLDAADVAALRQAAGGAGGLGSGTADVSAYTFVAAPAAAGGLVGCIENGANITLTRSFAATVVGANAATTLTIPAAAAVSNGGEGTSSTAATTLRAAGSATQAADLASVQTAAAGGLIGQVGYKTAITSCYADSYVYARLDSGAAAGLVGATVQKSSSLNGQALAVTNSFAAGFVCAQQTAGVDSTGAQQFEGGTTAGLVGGQIASVSSSYTAVQALALEQAGALSGTVLVAGEGSSSTTRATTAAAGAATSAAKTASTFATQDLTYSVAASTSTCKNTYFVSTGSDSQNTPATQVTYAQLSQWSADDNQGIQLDGAAFATLGTANTAGGAQLTSTPYNLAANNLTAYPFPLLAAQNHHGDWASAAASPETPNTPDAPATPDIKSGVIGLSNNNGEVAADAVKYNEVELGTDQKEGAYVENRGLACTPKQGNIFLYSADVDLAQYDFGYNSNSGDYVEIWREVDGEWKNVYGTGTNCYYVNFNTVTTASGVNVRIGTVRCMWINSNGVPPISDVIVKIHLASGEILECPVYKDQITIAEHVLITLVQSDDLVNVSGAPTTIWWSSEAEYVIPECPFEKEGYIFAGWRSNNCVRYYPGDTVTFDRFTWEFKLTPIWLPVDESKWAWVTYDLNGGHISGASGQYVITASYNETLFIPEREGYEFLYWQGSDGNVYYPYSNYCHGETLKGLTLTAVWKKQFHLVFDAAGGYITNSNDSVYISENTWTSFPYAVKENAVFQGWRDSAGNLYYSWSSISASSLDIDSDNVFTAVWKELAVLYFDYDGGTGTNDSITVQQNSSAYLPAAAKEGYTFLGWLRTDNNKTYAAGTQVGYWTGGGCELDGKYYYVAQWKKDGESGDSSTSGGSSGSTNSSTTSAIVRLDPNGANNCEAADYIAANYLPYGFNIYDWPRKDGFQFAGWYCAELNDTTSQYFDCTKYTEPGHVYVYVAQWTQW